MKRSQDRHTGFVAPKSRSGTRRVPITPTLRRELTITGKNLTGPTGVTFDMVKATFKVESATKISVPPSLRSLTPVEETAGGASGCG